MGDVVIFLWGLWVYGGMNVGTLQMLQQWTRACLCGCLKEKEDKEEEVLLCSTAHTGTDVASACLCACLEEEEEEVDLCSTDCMSTD